MVHAGIFLCVLFLCVLHPRACTPCVRIRVHVDGVLFFDMFLSMRMCVRLRSMCTECVCLLT
jgi:hypothetical protein